MYDDIDNVCFNYQFKNLTISNMKQTNNKPFYCLLLILSGDINLNPGPKNNLQSLDSNEWYVFNSKIPQLVHLNIISLLPKIDELQYVTSSSKTTVTGISEFKLNESVLQ